MDQEALYTALKDGKIAYAALDVTDPEPIAADDKLLTLPNIIVVPHIASAHCNHPDQNVYDGCAEPGCRRKEREIALPGK